MNLQKLNETIKISGKYFMFLNILNMRAEQNTKVGYGIYLTTFFSKKKGKLQLQVLLAMAHRKKHTLTTT